MKTREGSATLKQHDFKPCGKVNGGGGSHCVPVHIRSPLLQHGLFSFENLLRVLDVEEVDGHEERNRDVLPHGVGHVVLWVDHCVLTGQRGGS